MKPSAKETVPEVIERFKTYHAQNGAWGSLHVVLDDGNIHDHFVEGCIEYAKKQNDTEGLELGKILLKMSKSQRHKIAKMA